MESTLTLEQKKQLDSWASQRDSILLDIAGKKTESERLTLINNNLAISNTEISDKIQQSIGRLEEIEIKEEERAKFITTENVSLINLKSVLQTEVSSLQSEIVVLKDKKENIYNDIAVISKVHQDIFSRSSDIERIITETVTINSSNAREIKNILFEAGIELKKMIDIGSENVGITNKVISEIPKMVVDLHRDIIERKKINKHKISNI